MVNSDSYVTVGRMVDLSSSWVTCPRWRVNLHPAKPVTQLIMFRGMRMIDVMFAFPYWLIMVDERVYFSFSNANPRLSFTIPIRSSHFSTFLSPSLTALDSHDFKKTCKTNTTCSVDTYSKAAANFHCTNHGFSFAAGFLIDCQPSNSKINNQPLINNVWFKKQWTKNWLNSYKNQPRWSTSCLGTMVAE